MRDEDQIRQIISHGAPWPEFLDLEDLGEKHLDPYESSLDTLLPLTGWFFQELISQDRVGQSLLLVIQA